jgi:AAA+ ATPase superfamily predicted ATPase
LVGGIPKYWEYVNKNESVIDLANILYFQSGAILENEPHRMLSDEKVEGITPLNVLEAIGRGVHKPSEIGGRIGASQGSLSKVFALLINSSLIVRETPFGKPAKDSKKGLYKINDPMLKFWFSVYSGLRSQWMKMTDAEKKQAIYQNASFVFEDEVRKMTGGSRLWNDKEEYDIVFSNTKNSVNVVEVKFDTLTKEKKIALQMKLNEKVKSSKFFSNFQQVNCSIIDWSSVHRQCSPSDCG